MKVLCDYLVDVKPVYEEASGFLIDGGAKALPIGGKIAASPPGYPSGKNILFQYNAYFEAAHYKGLQFVSPEVVYAVDGTSLNGWCIIKSSSPGFGKVLVAPQFLKPGDEIRFEPARAHKIESPLFVADTLYAIRFRNILLYRKKGLSLEV